MHRPGLRASLKTSLRHRTALAALLLTAALALVSCDSSGPVKDTFLLEGEVLYQGEASHNLLSVDEGIIRIEVIDLRPKLIDITVGSTLVIGVGVGRPNNAGTCTTSFSTNAVKGSVFSLGLDKNIEYCVRLFDSGALPEDASVAYTVSVGPG